MRLRYPITACEYRAVFGGVFARLHGLDAAQLEAIFPGARVKDIGLL